MNTQTISLEPRYGYFPWWPTDGDQWIHPADATLVKQLVPSYRIWRCDCHEDDFLTLRYGDVAIRVMPNLWIGVTAEGLEVGDWVEVLSRMMRNTYRVGRIRQMMWDEEEQGIRYQIEVAGQSISTLYDRSDLRPVDPLTHDDD